MNYPFLRKYVVMPVSLSTAPHKRVVKILRLKPNTQRNGCHALAWEFLFTLLCGAVLSLLIMGLQFAVGEEISPQSSNSAEKSKNREEPTHEAYRKMKEELKLLDKDNTNGFDIESHLKLALWCLEKKWKQTAVKELLEIVKYAPENENVLWYLDNLGYVNYEGKWMTHETKKGLIEQKVRQLLTQLKNKDENKEQLAKMELEKISFPDKVNPLIHSLNDSNEGIRLYAIQELGEANLKSVVTPLVKVSLIDKSKNVKEQAFISAAKIDQNECINQYGRWAFNHDDASRIDAVNALNKLAKLDNPNHTVIQSESATYYLIITMYRITVFIKTRNVQLQSLRPFSVATPPPTGGTPADGTQTGETYQISLPWMRSFGISAMTMVPAETNIDLEKQLTHVTNVLEDSTGQKLGNDYTKWVAWWNERINTNKNKAK